MANRVVQISIAILFNFIGNLPEKCRDEFIQAAFIPFGDCTGKKILTIF